jgi:hypothetical protein
MKILDAEKWEYIFPLRNAVYTYEEFLKAVAKFPAVCAEK